MYRQCAQRKLLACNTVHHRLPYDSIYALKMFYKKILIQPMCTVHTPDYKAIDVLKNRHAYILK